MIYLVEFKIKNILGNLISYDFKQPQNMKKWPYILFLGLFLNDNWKGIKKIADLL